MDEHTTASDLLEPSLPGGWMAEYRRIWRMRLLKAHDFARFCSDRGLANLRAEGIVELQRLGLLKADLIESDKELAYDDLVARGTNRYGHYLYSDERQLHLRLEGWKDVEKTITSFNEGVKLLFHPFRYYVLYHLDRPLPGVDGPTMRVSERESYTHTVEWVFSFPPDVASFDLTSKSGLRLHLFALLPSRVSINAFFTLSNMIQPKHKAAVREQKT